MRKQPNYTCMLKNVLKLHCIWTWDNLWVVFFFVCSFDYFMHPLWWDNYRTTSEAPSPWLEAEMDTKIIKTETSLHLNMEVFFIFYFSVWFILFYIYFFFHLLIFYFYSYLCSFYFHFQSSLCVSNAFSAYGWLVHCLSLFISLKLLLFVFLFCFFLSTWLFVFSFSFNFFAFHPLSPFHSKYH
jgi:hypothetical protein